MTEMTSTTRKPQWLTVRNAQGDRITMRLPDDPQVHDVQAMLERVKALSEKSHGRMGGWSLTQGPTRRH